MKQQTILAITKSLSDPRFSTYLKVSNGDRNRALELYLWNIDMAGAIAATTGMVEVQLRNAIDNRLRIWNPSQQIAPGRTSAYSTNWLQDPAPKLAQIISPPNRRPLWEEASKAMVDLEGNPTKPTPNHDDLVAGLTFGSWLWLLPKPSVSPTTKKNPRMHIWNHALKHAFQPRAKSDYAHESHATIYQWANIIRFARNRASHLEPFLQPSEVVKVHRASLRLLNSINPAAASWLAGQNYILRTLDGRPHW